MSILSVAMIALPNSQAHAKLPKILNLKERKEVRKLDKNWGKEEEEYTALLTEYYYKLNEAHKKGGDVYKQIPAIRERLKAYNRKRDANNYELNQATKNRKELKRAKNLRNEAPYVAFNKDNEHSRVIKEVAFERAQKKFKQEFGAQGQRYIDEGNFKHFYAFKGANKKDDFVIDPVIDNTPDSPLNVTGVYTYTGFSTGTGVYTGTGYATDTDTDVYTDTDTDTGTGAYTDTGSSTGTGSTTGTGSGNSTGTGSGNSTGTGYATDTDTDTDTDTSTGTGVNTGTGSSTGYSTATNTGTATDNKAEIVKCQDDISAMVYNIMLQDKNGAVIPKLVDLTTFHIAQRVLAADKHTVEELVNKEKDMIGTQIKNIKDSLNDANTNAIKEKVHAFYAAQGETYDLNDINEKLTSAKGDLGSRCYWPANGKNRIYNGSNNGTHDTASAYVLAIALGDSQNPGQDVPLYAEDAEWVWFMGRVRDVAKFKQGSAEDNMLNMSTRVTQLLGTIASAKDLDASVLADKTEKSEKELKKAVNSAMAKVRLSSDPKTKACLDLIDNQSCVTCRDKWMSNLTNVQNIQEKILLEMAKEQAANGDLKKIGKLRHGLGNLDFTLSPFARGAQGEVDPGSHNHPLDPCGARSKSSTHKKVKKHY